MNQVALFDKGNGTVPAPGHSRRLRLQHIEVERIRPEEGLGRQRDREGHKELWRSIEHFGVLCGHARGATWLSRKHHWRSTRPSRNRKLERSDWKWVAYSKLYGGANPGGSTITVDGQATSAIVGQLDNKQNYYFTVTAQNGLGAGPAGISSVIPSVKSVADGFMLGSLEDFLSSKSDGPTPFNWDHDTCGGGFPDGFAAKPWLRHDFGYRNYGNGIRLQRDEDKKMDRRDL